MRFRQRGAAMLEAAIALPVLVIVLIAVPYVHSLFVAHQRAMASARLSAWSSALGKCGEGKDGPAIDAFGVLAELQEIDIVEDFIGDVLPRSMHTSSNQTVQRPKLIAASPDAIKASLHLTCNETWAPLDAQILNALGEYLP